MTYRNEDRKNRLRHVPEPAFRREPLREKEEIEDGALDTTLKVLADSTRDEKSFLLRVKSRLKGSQSQQVDVHDRSFFGFAEPLYVAPEEPDSKTTVSISTAESPKKVGNSKALLIGISTAAASLLLGLIAWHAYSNTTPKNELAVAEQVRAETGESNSVITENSNPSLTEPALLMEPNAIVEAQPKPPASLETDEAAKLAIADESNLNRNTEEDSTASLASSLGPFFHLHLQLDNFKTGSLSIGETKLKSDIPFEHAGAIVKCVCHEVSKQVHFYSPIMEKSWNGSLTISGPDFEFKEHFVGIDQMYEAGLSVRKQFKDRISKSDFQSPENSNAQSFAKQRSQASLIYDQVTDKALSITDALLEDCLDPDNFRPTYSLRYKNFAQLRKRDARLHNFARGLSNRNNSRPFAGFRVFHAKSPERLTSELEQATLFDLFEDSDEFNGWVKNTVKSTEKGRIRLRLEELDRVWDRLDTKSKSYGYSPQERYALAKEAQSVRMEIAKLRERSKTASRTPESVRGAKLQELIQEKPLLGGFDLAMGEECQLCDSDAMTLNQVSKRFGSMLATFDQFGTRNLLPNPNGTRAAKIRSVIDSVLLHHNPEQAIGTIDQMLQIEKKAIRLELVKVLGRMDSSITCRLLACYAKYDVDADVRIAATDALRTYPPEMSREELLEGFSYPWPDAARHAAEAIVRLNDTESIPQLVSLLERPDPRAPKVLSNGQIVRSELVAINHLRNCLLCHMDSHNEEDPGRGLVPSWTESLPQAYYQERDPRFARVRADVTYLRQDFSLLRKVEKPGKWPKNQRFDYVTWNRAISNKDAIEFQIQLEGRPNEYRASIDVALRELTGKSPLGTSSEDWKSVLEIN